MKSSIVKKIVAGALVVTAIPLTFMVGKNFDDIKDKIDDVFNPDEKKETGALIDGVENTDDDAQISMPKNITYVQTYDENQQKLTINVQVLPDYASNKNLSWTLGWASTNSAKASDYVDMQVGSDTHSVTLTYKKAFSTKLRLTVKSTDGSNITKTTDIDCISRNIALKDDVITDPSGDITNTTLGSIYGGYFTNTNYTITGGTVSPNIIINGVEYICDKKDESEGVYFKITTATDSTTMKSICTQKYSSLGFSSYQEMMSILANSLGYNKLYYSLSYKNINISNLVNNEISYGTFYNANFDSQLKVSDIVIDGGAGAL